MAAEKLRRLVVSVRPGGNPRRAREVARWIRILLPTAILLVAPAPPGAVDPARDEVIDVDADAVQSGPLSLADALVRREP